MSTPGEDLVEEYPNPIIVHRISETSFQDSSIYLTNKSNQYIVFKVYMNHHPPVYSLKPATSYLKPKDSVTLTLKRLFKPSNSDPNSKDKCLIIYYPVDKVVASNDEVKEMFKNKTLPESNKHEILVNIEVDNEIKVDSGSQGMTEEEINQAECANETSVDNLYQKNQQLKDYIRRAETAIGDLEKQLENVMKNKELKIQKEKAIQPMNTNKGTKSNKGNSLTFVVFLVLICLTVGGYCGTLKNKLLNKEAKSI